jgi:FlaA1/EpsC-like NDP-sugar epimerase
MQSKVIAWPHWLKRLVVMALDVLLALAATWIGFSLRYEVWHWPSGQQWWVYGLTPLLAIPIFIKFGLYRAIFRYTGQAALQATTRAVVLYGAVLFGILLWQRWLMVPRTLGVLQPLIFLLLVGASRVVARFWLLETGPGRAPVAGRLLIYGAGAAGVQTASALAVSGQYVLLGFIDDDRDKIGRSVNGSPVYGPAKVAELVTQQAVSEILLALPAVSRERRNQILASLQHLPVHIRTLPALSDLASGRVTVQDIRELDVEDLLARAPVPPDAALLASQLAGQVVLVSGAGGSIGAELTRQILLCRPRLLLLLDHNEFGLYNIHQELLALCAKGQLTTELLPLLGSVANLPRLHAIFSGYRPTTVYHAAAYKHVPMVEDNPGEGILNNVFGTLNMAQAAKQHGVRRFVLVSTDKAVRPTNVMGASKRLAEMVLQAYAQQAADTCFTMVRFGNVLGSSGSVVPLFRRQIAEGGPITLTHLDVTRYFMTIPEAAQLVLQAGAMAVGGDVFVLDMGQPIKIIDLARRMVQLSGLTLCDPDHPHGDIAIEVTGLRPGEKLYEELLIGDNPEPTGHPRIMKAHEPFLPWDALTPALAVLLAAAQAGDTAAIKAFLLAHVHGYSAGSGSSG